MKFEERILSISSLRGGAKNVWCGVYVVCTDSKQKTVGRLNARRVHAFTTQTLTCVLCIGE